MGKEKTLAVPAQPGLPVPSPAGAAEAPSHVMKRPSQNRCPPVTWVLNKGPQRPVQASEKVQNI